MTEAIKILSDFLQQDVGMGAVLYPLVLEFIILVCERVTASKRMYVYFRRRHLSASVQRIGLFLFYSIFSQVLVIVTHISEDSLQTPIEVLYLAYALLVITRTVFYSLVPLSMSAIFDLISKSTEKKYFLRALADLREATPLVVKYSRLRKAQSRVRACLTSESFASRSLFVEIAYYVTSYSGAFFRDEGVVLPAMQFRIDQALVALREVPCSRFLNMELLMPSIEDLYQEIQNVVSSGLPSRVEGPVREYFLIRVWQLVYSREINYLTYSVQNMMMSVQCRGDANDDD